MKNFTKEEELVDELVRQLTVEMKPLLEQAKDPNEKIKALGHAIHANTLKQKEYEPIWKKYGFKAHLEDDGKFYTGSITGVEAGITDDATEEDIKRILRSVDIAFIISSFEYIDPETLALGERIYPEFQEAWKVFKIK